MAKEFAKDFYNSPAWKNTRRAYAKSVNMLCEDCLRRGMYNAGEIVHHKTPLTAENIRNPQIALSWDNLKLVCRKCHEQEHRSNGKCYYFDEYGNIVPK